MSINWNISLRLFKIPEGKKLLAVSLVLVLVTFVFGSFFSSNSVFEASAAFPKDPKYDSGRCVSSDSNNYSIESCCWDEGDGVVSPKYTVCQTCVTYYWPVYATACREPYVTFSLPESGPITNPLDNGGVIVGDIFGLPLNLRDILNMPENQSLSLSTQHGPNSDTIKLEIPKALSDPILNQTNCNYNQTPKAYSDYQTPKAYSDYQTPKEYSDYQTPKAYSDSILNQTNYNQTAK